MHLVYKLEGLEGVNLRAKGLGLRCMVDHNTDGLNLQLLILFY